MPQPPSGAVPERPKQVLVASIMMFVLGVIGVLSFLLLAYQVFEWGFSFLSFIGLYSVILVGSPLLHIGVGILGVFVVRGKGGARMAFFVVGGISVLFNGLNVANTFLGDHRYSFFVVGPPMLPVLMAVITLIAAVIAIAMLAPGGVGRWFQSVKAAGPRRPMPYQPPQGYPQPGQQQPPQFQQQPGQQPQVPQQMGQPQMSPMPGGQPQPMPQPQQGNYPPQGNQPPQMGQAPAPYPQQGNYPPQGGQPPQGNYPPQGNQPPQWGQ